jgi:large subunit ribosomal protein L15
MEKFNLKRKNKNKKSRQIGRGGVKAKTAGRGTKGQNARSGRKKRPELRDFIKKLPKLRGRGKNINTSIQSKPVVLNLEVIAKNYKSGETVSPQTLFEKKLLDKYKGVLPSVKILGKGDISFDLNFSRVSLSRDTLSKIEKVGGKIVK